jgi:hypothetical protein
MLPHEGKFLLSAARSPVIYPVYSMMQKAALLDVWRAVSSLFGVKGLAHERFDFGG